MVHTTVVHESTLRLMRRDSRIEILSSSFYGLADAELLFSVTYKLS